MMNSAIKNTNVLPSLMLESQFKLIIIYGKVHWLSVLTETKGNRRVYGHVARPVFSPSSKHCLVGFSVMNHGYYLRHAHVLTEKVP